MIRILSEGDSEEYFKHLSFVMRHKGLASIKDRDKATALLEPVVTLENTKQLLASGKTEVWAEFSEGTICKSIRVIKPNVAPVALLFNYKSSLVTPFSPVKDLLPLLAKVLNHYEERGVYTFKLVRRLDLFDSKRLPLWEENYPLNRYNSYYDEILAPGEASEYSLIRDLLGNMTFPIPMAVVTMALKQEYRTYKGKTYPAINRAGKTLDDSLKTTYYILGVSDSKGLGFELANELEKQSRQVRRVGRANVDFSGNFVEALASDQQAESGEFLCFVINLFDYSSVHIQEYVFKTLWDRYKDFVNVHIVVIGSLAHYYQDLPIVSRDYREAKRVLRTECFRAGLRSDYKCRLLLVEPGTLDNFVKENREFTSSYFVMGDFVSKLIQFMDMNDRFMSVSLSGNKFS